jgi:hypothetical protein
MNVLDQWLWNLADPHIHLEAVQSWWFPGSRSREEEEMLELWMLWMLQRILGGAWSGGAHL